MSDREELLEISPYESDGGHSIGKHPKEVPSEILARYYPAKNPLKALRARCLDCCCGIAAEVRKCVSAKCPSWPFRMGVNPFRAKRTLSDAQREALRRVHHEANEDLPGGEDHL
jgi:hypothetical protein